MRERERERERREIKRYEGGKYIPHALFPALIQLRYAGSQVFLA